MARIIEGFHVKKNRVLTNKRYRWFIPKALDSEISKGDTVLVRTTTLSGDKKAYSVLVIDILEDDKEKHEPVICILSKYNGEKVKSNRKKKKKRYFKKKTKSKENIEETKVEAVTTTKRGSKFSEEEKESIKAHRSSGKTLKEIAEMYSCSISTIHKIVKP